MTQERIAKADPGWWAELALALDWTFARPDCVERNCVVYSQHTCMFLQW